MVARTPDPDTDDSTITGVHPVYEALVSDARPVRRLHIRRGPTPARLGRILELAEARHIPVRREPRESLDRVAGNSLHQGVVAIVGSRSYVAFETVLETGNPLLVVLDGVEDPHNLGAVIRTAETAGASAVVVTERRSAGLTPAVSRASAGALEHLPVSQVTNLASSLKAMKSKGIWVVAVDPQGPALWTEFDYTVPVALVFGGEHHGIRRLVRESCDVRVRLPVHGKVDSLNVSVAAGIVLYEVVRQRGTRE